MEFSIKALGPGLVNDYLYFFDHVPFTEHPDWSKCYCYSFHFTGSRDQWNRESNRAAARKLILEKKLKGFLAFKNGRPVGWCNVNERDAYQRLRMTYDIEENRDLKIASVVCFVVHPDARRKGVAGLLLDRAIKEYSLKKYDYLEAYPLKEEHSCEKNYRGPLAMYLKRQFEIASEHKNYYILRRFLRNGTT